MRTCYKLSDSYTVFEMEEIADIFYQRCKRIKAFLETSTDEKKLRKANILFFRLYFIVVKMTIAVADARLPMPPSFPSGGVPVSMRR